MLINEGLNTYYWAQPVIIRSSHSIFELLKLQVGQGAFGVLTS